MLNLGTVRPGSTIRIPFSTFDKDDGSSITMTNFAAADILIYKDGSTTERASTSGFTATTDFDSKTGKHLIVIDLADNTTADFFAAGSEYLVAIDAVTVDAVTVGGWVARFCIGYEGAFLNTTIATLASQTSFTLTSGPAEDDALNGRVVIIHDAASAVQCGSAIILDYTGSTKTVTLAAATTFTIAAKDNIAIMDLAPLQPATAGRTAAIGTSGQIDANITQFGGSAGTFSGGRPEVNASHAGGTAWGSGAITAASIAADAITDAKVASDVTIASVTGSVGSVTGNVGGSVASVASGGITSASFAAGAINAAAIAADAIGASELAADAVAEIAAGVWDLATSGHTTGGTFGAAMVAAGSAGDPWSTSLPGAYSSGTAGYIVGTNLNETVSSRLATSGYTAPSNLTASQIATGVWQDTTAGDFTVASSIGKSLYTTGNAPGAASGLAIVNSAMTLTSGERTSIADAMLDQTAGVETNRTVRQSLRLMLSALVGKLSGAATSTVAIRDTNDTKNRISATVDADGNRSAVTLDGT